MSLFSFILTQTVRYLFMLPKFVLSLAISLIWNI